MVDNVELYTIYYNFFLHENWPSLPPFKVKVLGKFEGAVEAILTNILKKSYIATILQWWLENQTAPVM